MRKCTTLARMTKSRSRGIPKPLILSAQSPTPTTTSSTLYQVLAPLSFGITLQRFQPRLSFPFMHLVEAEQLDTETNIADS